MTPSPTLAETRAAIHTALVAANPGVRVHSAPLTAIASDCIAIQDPTIEFEGPAKLATVTWIIMLYYVRVPQQPVSSRFDDWVQTNLAALAKGAGCGFVLQGATPQTDNEFQVPAYGIVGTTSAVIC